MKNTQTTQNTQNTIKILKQNSEDFEWYPTTNEILETINKDLIKLSTIKQNRNFKIKSKDNSDFDLSVLKLKSKIKWDYNYNQNDKEYTYKIESMLDIGAGDGRALEYLKPKHSYAIEKSIIQSEDLIKKNIRVIGNDFYDTILIDRTFDVVYCNPPYTQFKDFTEKITKEVNAGIIYFCIPDRWQNNLSLVREFNKKGIVEVIGSFDFSEGDREARSKVNLIRIITNSNDTFSTWADENIGEFKSNKELNLDENQFSEDIENAIINRKTDIIHMLVDNYNYKLEKLMETFQKLGSIDFDIIEQLGIKRDDVLSKIKDDIKNLKLKHWNLSFNTLEEITNKLTYSKREEILNEIKWFRELDFNVANIRTVVIWVLHNHNKLSNQQMEKVYDELTDKENVKPYKSNDKWTDDNWRYNKPVPTKYSLDYRLVVPVRISEYGWEKYKNNTIFDICVVANSLGFNVDTMPETEEYYEIGKHLIYSKELKSKDKILFEYKMYKNGNTHFKLNQEFLMTLNVEVGKLKGWIKSPKDITDEFDIDIDTAYSMFNQIPKNIITTKNTQILLKGN